jgi:multicomponent K+:H+ antiporter subunit D
MNGMMGHWILLPIVLPAIAAPAIVLLARNDILLARVFSFASAFAVAGIAVALLLSAAGGTPEMYALGNWPAPFGIVVVLDRLSAVMVLLTAVVAIAVLFYASEGWDRRGRHFHALLQFELMGLNGAFLTGDVFNLFVFFEVLLISSYGLMLHGGGGDRLKAGFQYVVVNLVGSTLFLFAVGMIYAVTGTLNMADLALKVSQVPAEDLVLLHAGATLLLLVFAVKAALVPVHFWLVGTYANAPAPVAALFAIMTKVGAYSIIRVYTLIFGAGAGDSAWLAEPWLLPVALVTLVVGSIGVLAAASLGRLVGFAVIGSMGTLMVAVAGFTPQSLSAALYYLLHSTVAAAALFMIVGLVRERRGRHGDFIVATVRFRDSEVLSVLFFLAAIAMVGLPPLSGFVGKLLILDGTRGSYAVGWIWSIILITSMIMTIGFARAGSRLFWKSAAVDEMEEVARPTTLLPVFATGAAVLATVALTVFAGPVTDYLDATAGQLFDSTAYIDAVLDPPMLAAR